MITDREKLNKKGNVRVTLRCVRATIVAAEKQISVTYSECAYVVLGVRVYFIFPYYLINSTIFEKKLLNIKCVLIFSTTFSETFLITRRTERDMIKNVYWSSY